MADEFCPACGNPGAGTWDCPGCATHLTAVVSPSPTPEPGDDAIQRALQLLALHGRGDEARAIDARLAERNRLASELAPLRELAEWLASCSDRDGGGPTLTRFEEAIDRARTALGRDEETT